MGRTDILTCPSCDHKRRMTESESSISYALVVACLKCGTVMQCNPEKKSKPPETQQTFLESCILEAVEDRVVS
jgi:transcription elongation factor Elf1